ncbi:MAG: response regulator [Desulfotignum sp.]|nr:response regulator [Desulfotignum sp.]
MPETGSAPPRVLVVDDETAILKMLALALSRKGYQVDTAQSGEQAVERLRSADYSLVITDMRMEKMSGDEVLQEVKHIKGDNIPVVAMSGTPWLMDESKFDAVLAKPYLLKDFFDLVKKFVPAVPAEQSIS